MKNIVVIGAGIVGLATAWQAQKNFPGVKIIVLEKEPIHALHQTGRNSGVIHSGIYYKPGTKKAHLCRQGYEMILHFARFYDIPFRISGKLIVARSPGEFNRLYKLYENGRKNGLDDLEILDKKAIAKYEPHIKGLKAIRVPQTGVIDFTKVTDTLAEIITLNGGEILYNHQVLALEKPGRPNLITNRGNIKADRVVVCAGLHSDRLFGKKYRIIPFRGEYFKLKPGQAKKINGLVYPVPDPRFPFLGIHITRHINNKVTAGPNAVLAFGREAYRKTAFNLRDTTETFTWPGFWKLALRYGKIGISEMIRSLSKRQFTREVSRWIPGIHPSDLIPHPSGIRAQVVDKSGNLIDDFIIEKEGKITYVVNAPSPAATASLAIAQSIVGTIENTHP